MDLRAWFVNEIAPCVRADGGWLEIKDDAGEIVRLTARGECAHCAALGRCLKWAEGRAERELGRAVRFEAVREPFLWRK